MYNNSRVLVAACAVGMESLMAMLPVSVLHAQAIAAAATAAAGTDSGALQEVVVTARRRTENLQDVPLAVTAISADTLTRQNVTNLEDLNSFAPNIKISADPASTLRDRIPALRHCRRLRLLSHRRRVPAARVPTPGDGLGEMMCTAAALRRFPALHGAARPFASC